MSIQLWSALAFGSLCAVSIELTSAVELQGSIVDEATGKPIAARVYLQNERGEWLFVESADRDGSALPYREEWVPMPQSVERHTTLSAHPFRIHLPAGSYTIEIERGKEYRPLKTVLKVADQPLTKIFALQRWANASKRGWYSGETHVHRRIHELPNVMLAEDLNVAFPVTFWTTRSDRAPDLAPSTLRSQGPSPFGPREDRGAEPISVDREHVILPRNTEYEFFSIGDRRHTLGAVFVLNHKSVFSATAPPIGEIAELAHREGALLDLDKHSWPWSMMLVPVAKVDLFELSNNSVWRTKFGFNQLSAKPPAWMKVEQDSPTTLTEWGWLQYGFENWYALLNCGFRLSPTAGTASGVHPVPLGFSRVYVHTGKAFDLEQWLAGLKAGRSFVTTGPLLFAEINRELPGKTFRLSKDQENVVEITVESLSTQAEVQLELLRNGEVIESHKEQGERTPEGAFRTTLRKSLRISESCWVAVRSIEPQLDGRKRFAHTGAWFFSVDDAPIRPRRDQVEYFVQLLDAEIERNRAIIDAKALAEFKQARDAFRALLPSEK